MQRRPARFVHSITLLFAALLLTMIVLPISTSAQGTTATQHGFDSIETHPSQVVLLVLALSIANIPASERQTNLDTALPECGQPVTTNFIGGQSERYRRVC